jgi:hypothetical protein
MDGREKIVGRDGVVRMSSNIDLPEPPVGYSARVRTILIGFTRITFRE